jgi:hypothetical protein
MPDTAPPTPPSTMKIEALPDTKSPTAGTDQVARIVSNVNPTAYPLRIKENKATKPVQIVPETATPQIIRRETTGQKGRTVNPSVITKSVTPSIERPSRIQTGLATETIAITHPITGQDITVSQKTAIMQILNPVIDRIDNQPVNVPATPRNKPPKGPPRGIGLIPFLRMGDVKIANMAHRTDVKINPVPDILKVI